MSENPGASDNTVAGAVSRSARRRRRRSRRRSSGNPSSPQNSAAQKKKTQNSGAESASSSSSERGEQSETSQSKTNRQSSARRGRRTQNQRSKSAQRSGAKSKTRQQKQRKTRSGASSSGTARRKNRRRTATQNSQATSSMPTRHETSAGGLVLSGLAEAVSGSHVDLSRIYVALIGRLDRRRRLLWSMPKGHVENDEEVRLTAEREVWEETGIYGEVIAELGVIDYWFVSDGVRIHKTVHHHLLRYVDGDLNDEDPEVTEVAWIPVSELIEHLAYADERKLARTAVRRLPALARQEKTEGRVTPR
ncbi:NUDIX domain-containing protein [Corynebacterium sp. 3HC-13]|uniref:NUDIX hydrolase n=1 Tax=Corynebacterium poyangense TaxID=2684405 RepID=UPI001CCFD9B1|nr:NUDIX hydrolase [Corynebacterium poyangense]MBZ8177266.1 NUDIX domain-containing protein [Corynebacterium poyangense]